MVFFYFFIFCFFPKSVNVVPNHVTPLTELIFFWHFVWRVEKFIVSTCVRWRVTEGQLSQEKHLLLILLHTVMLFFPVLVVLSHAFLPPIVAIVSSPLLSSPCLTTFRSACAVDKHFCWICHSHLASVCVFFVPPPSFCTSPFLMR